jgi:hypothetical protein
MSVGEATVLALIIAAFLVFSGVLGWVSAVERNAGQRRTHQRGRHAPSIGRDYPIYDD